MGSSSAQLSHDDEGCVQQSCVREWCLALQSTLRSGFEKRGRRDASTGCWQLQQSWRRVHQQGSLKQLCGGVKHDSAWGCEGSGGLISGSDTSCRALSRRET